MHYFWNLFIYFFNISLIHFPLLTLCHCNVNFLSAGLVKSVSKLRLNFHYKNNVKLSIFLICNKDCGMHKWHIFTICKPEEWWSMKPVHVCYTIPVLQLLLLVLHKGHIAAGVRGQTPGVCRSGVETNNPSS